MKFLSSSSSSTSQFLGSAASLAFALSQVSSATGSSLDDVCTTEYVKSVLPSDDTIDGVTVRSDSVTANTVTNVTISGENDFPDAVIDYCNVTFAYSHTGTSDSTTVKYWLPSPDDFQNRYLSTGGGGYAINSGERSLPGGIIYGAVAGATDGGFGSFSTDYDTIALINNGTLNYPNLFSFSYKAIHELSQLGKQFTKNFFNSTKIYSYYQACSEGGREGFSQVQRYGSQFDGVAIGAPALRYSFQQVNHLQGNLVEKTLNYFPSPCELAQINTDLIDACDELDGKKDGVVSRTDLCKLNYNVSSSIGNSYSCEASGSSTINLKKRQMMTQSATPATNGTVSKEATEVAQTILNGLQDSDGKQVYLSYQPGAKFADAATAYNEDSGEYELSISSFGAEFVNIFLKEINATNFDSLDGITYDTLRDWMVEGLHKYQDSLQTTWPDLTDFQEAGGKILHYHGELDSSIPPASSVRYQDSVRSVMYPQLSLNDSFTQLNGWYRLFLVPGAEHCAPNTNQVNGSFPQTNLNVLIDWVESGTVPTTLNATVLQGDNIGHNRQICTWPLRPLYDSESESEECVFDQASYDSWIYNLDAIKVPVY